MGLLPSGNVKAAYISNAMDAGSNVQGIADRQSEDMADLTKLGFDVEHVDLREYFETQDALQRKLEEFGLLWFCGGNVFVLRQAMKLSGCDAVIHALLDSDIVYGGYSAGCCVLAPSLRGYHIVDDPDAKPYGQEHQTIWDGLGILDYSISPHYDSDHPESADIAKEIAYCQEHGIAYKPLRDGEVIIIE